MLDYTFLIHDDRYSVPTLRLQAHRDDDDAIRHGQAMIAESPHHLRVEISRDGARIAELGA